MKQKNLYFYTNLLAWGLVLLLIGNYVFGWTTPTATPPSSNLPAPINEGPDSQTKEGNLIIEGVLRLGQFTTANAPSGAEGALYFDTTDNTTKLYSNSEWGDLGGSGEPGQLPTYTTAQRDALSPTAGLMIYNTDYDQVQTYTQTAWSGITGSKDLGIECASAMDCASGFCVDSICCDTSTDNCNGDCEACNLIGYMGICTVRVNLDNTETPTCYYCNGTSDTSLAYTGNTGKNCTGINGCNSGICQNSFCDEDNDTHYSITSADCVSGRYSFTVGDDCDESCATCYPGSTATTASPDGKDQDCDGVVDEVLAITCTPIYGSSASMGYDGACNWATPGPYMFALASGNAPADNSHCILSGTTCTSYSGGWGTCSYVAYPAPGWTDWMGPWCYTSCRSNNWLASMYCTGQFNVNYTLYYTNCLQMSGCTKLTTYN